MVPISRSKVKTYCKVFCINPAFALYILVLYTMSTTTEADLICHKRLPEISTDNCCSLPNFYTEEIKEKCGSNEDHFKLDLENQHRCFISCAIDEIGIFNDGKFQEEVLSSYLTVSLQDSPDVIDDMKIYFTNCSESYEILGKMIPTQGRCALYPVLIMDCVFIKTFKNCPDSNWSNTDGCNEIRDYWSQCLPNEMK